MDIKYHLSDDDVLIQNNEFDTLCKKHLSRIKAISFREGKKYGLHFDDAFSCALEGFVRAYKKFSGEASFSTYYPYWIKAMINSYYFNKHSMIKIHTTVTTRRLFFQYWKHYIDKQTGELRTDEELSSMLGVSIKQLNDFRIASYCQTISENTPLLTTEDFNISDTLAFSTHDEELNNICKFQKITSLINDFIIKIDEKEKYILLYRLYPIYNKEYSLQEIGDILNLSRERIRQIESRLLQKLKVYLKNNNITHTFLQE